MRHLPYIGSGPYCYANSFAMMFGEHAPSTAVIEFATGSPFGMQMLGARCRCSIPMAGIRTLASTARWRRWVGVRTAVAAAARARRRNDCTTRWRMVLPGSVRSRWDTSGISLA